LLHKRDAAKLKLQWNSIRSKFYVAYSNWSKSDQADPETFISFTQGDDALLHVFCVFEGKPSIEQILRLIPEDARREDGIMSVDDQK
jgi:hypothetical protein